MIRNKIILSAIIVSALLVGCIKERCDHNPAESSIRFHVENLLPDSLDSFSGLSFQSFKIAVYPTGLSSHLMYNFTGQVGSLFLAQGSYRVLLYTSDFFDVDATFYRGIACVETAEAYARQYKVGDDVYLEEPDPVFSTSVNLVDNNTSKQLDIDLHPRVFTYRFRIETEGLKYVKAAQAIITGIHGSVYLKDGSHPIAPPMNMIVDLQLKGDHMEGAFRSFGPQQQAYIPHKIAIRLMNNGGEVKTVELKDLTALIKPLLHGGIIAINQKIVITGDNSGAGFDPDINDWNDDEVVLPVT